MNGAAGSYQPIGEIVEELNALEAKAWGTGRILGVFLLEQVGV